MITCRKSLVSLPNYDLEFIYRERILLSLHLIDLNCTVKEQINTVCGDNSIPDLTYENYVVSQVENYLFGKNKKLDLFVELKGTEFQKNVWNCIMQIPYGNTLCYSEIAQRVGNCKAYRAVGTACSKNPIWLVVPCHRVIASNGNYGGYAGGLELKKHLLSLEQS